MSLADHPGLGRIHPDDLCTECNGLGWVSAQESTFGRGHPCFNCNGTGDIRYRGKSAGTVLPVRDGEPVKSAVNARRYAECMQRYKDEEKTYKSTQKHRRKKIEAFKAVEPLVQEQTVVAVKDVKFKLFEF